MDHEEYKSLADLLNVIQNNITKIVELDKLKTFMGKYER